FGVALTAAALFLRLMRMEALGMSFTPVLTEAGILRGLVLTLTIGVLAGLYPALRAARLNIAQTLRE
ncbi:MAG TPA: ABC transporter permease, partial [Anaerolineae bacterium]|nr:ABC transporter permease [Anaerolineae bacterium]